MTDNVTGRPASADNDSFDATYNDQVEAARRNRELIIELARWRAEHGPNQREVAKKMHTSQPAVTRLESHRHDPQLSTLARYVGALGLTLDFVLTDSQTGARIWTSEDQPETESTITENATPEGLMEASRSVVWSEESERELEALVSDPAVRQEIRRNAEETLHFVRNPSEHEGVAGEIMWHRCTTHAQERRIQEDWDDEFREEDEDTPAARASNYYLFYRPGSPGEFEVLGVRHIRQLAAIWQRMSGVARRSEVK